MPGVILTTLITNNSPIPGLGRGFRKVLKLVLMDTGTFWHRKLLAGHFTPNNQARYQHETRTPVYSKDIKPKTGTGQGRFVDNVLKGKTRRFMLALAKVTATSRAARVRMKAPAHVKRPYIGTIRKTDGTLGRITQQPDKAKELTAIDIRDRTEIERFASQKSLPKRIAETKQTTRTKL